MCVLNSDWSAVQTPSARFRRPFEDEQFRLVGRRIQKKRQYQTETYPTGDSDRDRSRYMFENVLTILSQSIITGCSCVQRNARCISIICGPLFFFIYCSYIFHLNCVVFSFYISMVATVFFLSSNVVHVPHSCFLSYFYFDTIAHIIYDCDRNYLMILHLLYQTTKLFCIRRKDRLGAGFFFLSLAI